LRKLVESWLSLVNQIGIICFSIWQTSAYIFNRGGDHHSWILAIVNQSWWSPPQLNFVNYI